MAETEYSQQNVASILTRLGNVESMLRFTVAASADVRSHVAEALKARDGAPEIYLLLADGPMSQPQLIDRSKYSQANVSKICSHLVRCGLVARDSNPEGRGYLWRWSDVEDIVDVSKIATKFVGRSKKSPHRGSNGDAPALQVNG